MKFINCFAMMLLLLVAPGCSSISLTDTDTWLWWKDNKAKAPTRLVTTWKDERLFSTGKKPTRGFGGRLFFYNNETEKPVEVEGQLVVFAYEENSAKAQAGIPNKKFVFPAEHLKRYLDKPGKDSPGPSYSIWLPWDAVGGERKNISLIAHFIPEEGDAVVGDTTHHLLPGSKPQISGTKVHRRQRQTVVTREPGVQPVSYDSETQRERRDQILDRIHTKKRKPRFKVQTITLPSGNRPSTMARPSSDAISARRAKNLMDARNRRLLAGVTGGDQFRETKAASPQGAPRADYPREKPQTPEEPIVLRDSYRTRWQQYRSGSRSVRQKKYLGSRRFVSPTTD